jgi:hypothetical protein
MVLIGTTRPGITKAIMGTGAGRRTQASPIGLVRGAG